MPSLPFVLLSDFRGDVEAFAQRGLYFGEVIANAFPDFVKGYCTFVC